MPEFSSTNVDPKAYQEALDWLFVQMPNYQADGKKAYKPGLENITKLCNHFQNPQNFIKTIHVGGTNGKGSTSNMLASILQEQGYKVGLYNSPHLIDFSERIKVNGQNCSKAFILNFINRLKNIPQDIRPSFFEFTTIMAFEYFKEQNVDFAIIEVGLGGRLDSTNIIQPILTAITNVDLDHQDILGNTLQSIAKEKAGIIKSVPIVSGDENEEVKKIIQQKAEENGARLVDATTIISDLKSDLKGNYQHKNIKVVLAMVDELRSLNIAISDQSIKNGLLNIHKNTGFIGRWFEFSQNPQIICDTAHNFAGLDHVIQQLNDIPKRKHIVLGFVEDKEIDEILAILPPEERYYFAKPNINRGRNPQTYVDELKKANLNYKIFNSVQEAYITASEYVKSDEIIFVGGSNFVVGEFLEKNLQK